MKKLGLINDSPILSDQNKRYVILRTMEGLLGVESEVPPKYQLLLLDCLESEDPTLSQLTVKLLFQTINSRNIELIIGKINGIIERSSEEIFRSKTIARLFDIVSSKSLSHEWFLKQSLRLLRHGSVATSHEVLNGVMRGLIDEVQFEDDPQEIVRSLFNVFSAYLNKHEFNDPVF